MKKIFTFLIIISTVPLFSQSINSNNEVRGIVKLQNSKDKRLSEVKISPYFGGANPCYSDSEGNFLLRFPDKAVGDHVVLDVQKEGYQWINEESTRNVVIPKNKHDYAIVIVMNNPRLLREEANKILNLRLKNLEDAYEKKLLELSNNYSNDTSVLNQELRLLNRKFEKQKARSQEFALRFAKVDLDQSTNYYRQAYEYFLNGKIDSALIILEDEKIDTVFENTIELKRKVNQHIKQAVEVFKLKAEVHFQNLEYKKAAQTYKKVTSLLNDSEANAYNFGLHKDYQFLGQIYFELEEYDSAFLYQRKAITFLENQSDPSHPDLEMAYKMLNLISNLRKQNSSRLIPRDKEPDSLNFPESDDLNLIATVLPFTTSFGYDPVNVDYSMMLAERIQTALVQTQRFVVVERIDVEKVLGIRRSQEENESDYQFWESIPDNLSVEAGRQLGVDYIITGNISNVATPVLISGGYQGEIGFTIKIISVKTGKLFLTESFNLSANKLLGKNSKKEALNAALEKLSRSINLLIDQYFPLELPFLKIHETNRKGLPKTIIIKGGFANGLRIGQKLDIAVSKGNDYMDKLGEVEINEISEDYSTCKVLKGAREIAKQAQKNQEIIIAKPLASEN